MGSWNQIYDEIAELSIKRKRLGPYDIVRNKYLAKVHELSGRNVVAYYSGFLHRVGPEYGGSTSITDDDKNGFMAAFAGLDWSKGLDLILHTPGGHVAATESIIDYIRSKFGDNVRTIVPQISMSGGTMIACAGKTIVMGSHSNLGPIDPQFGSMPAIAFLKAFQQAKSDLLQNKDFAELWKPMFAKYPPTLLSSAEQAIKWSEEIGRKALLEGMLKGVPNAVQTAEKIVSFLTSHDLHKAHGRHLHRKELRDAGLIIEDLETDQNMQDAILSVHHAFMNTMIDAPIVKIVENHKGIASIRTGKPISVGMPATKPTPSTKPPTKKQSASVSKAPLAKRLSEAMRVLRGK